MDENKLNRLCLVDFQKLTPNELMSLTASGSIFRTNEIASACAMVEFPALQERAIKSGKVDPEILAHLSDSNYPTIRAAIASATKDVDLIKKMSKDSDADVKKLAIYNKHAPADVALLRAKYELEKRLLQKSI